MGELLLILISTSLVNNLVLDHMLGTDPAIALSKKHTPVIDMSILALMTMPVVSILSYILNFTILVPFNMDYLRIISMVLLVTIVTLLTGIISRKYFPFLYKRIGILIPLSMVNCTVLGLALLASIEKIGPVGAIFFGLGSALGFSLVLMAVTSIRDKVSVCDVPLPFRGISILMITFGLLSMAFMGFNGLSSLK